MRERVRGRRNERVRILSWGKAVWSWPTLARIKSRKAIEETCEGTRRNSKYAGGQRIGGMEEALL